MIQPLSKVICECGAKLKLPPLKGKRFRCRGCGFVHDSPYQSRDTLQPVKGGLKKMAPKRKKSSLRRKSREESPAPAPKKSGRLALRKKAPAKRKSGRLSLAARGK